MEINIQKLKSDLILNVSHSISSNVLSSSESSLLKKIEEIIKSENSYDLINIFYENETSKKIVYLLLKTNDSEFHCISNFLIRNNCYLSLEFLNNFFHESFVLNNCFPICSSLSNYLKLLQISLLNYPSISNIDLESQSQILYKLIEVSNKTNELNELIPFILTVVRIIYFKYYEINATNTNIIKSVILEIEKAISNQNKDVNIHTALENEMESIRTTIQNYLIKNDTKFDTSSKLSDLIDIFNKIKKKKEDLNIVLINKKHTLKMFSNIVHEIKTLKKSSYTLNEEIDYITRIENLFNEINGIDESIQGLYNSISKSVFKLKENTEQKILVKIHDFIQVNNKSIIINLDKNLQEIQNINSLFANVYIDLIISIYENFLRFFINKNAEICYCLKDNTISMNIQLKVDHSNINYSLNFINKAKAIKEIFKILKTINYSKLDSFKIKYSFLNGELTRTAENNIYYILAVLLKNSFELYKETVKSKESSEYFDSIRNFDDVITFIRTNFELLKDYKFCDEGELSVLLDDETSDDKIILKLRDNVVNSYKDLKKNNLKQFNLINFLKDFLFTDIDNNDEVIVKLNEFICIHFNFSYPITITQNFDIVATQLASILLDNKFSSDRKIDLIQKLTNILIHLYNVYFRNLNSNEKTILLNNIEIIRVLNSIVKNFFFKYHENSSLVSVIENINIYLKKYYVDNLSENIQLLISEVNEMVINYETFENSNLDRSRYQGFFNKIINIILSHFNKWKYLSDKDFLYFFNYITTLVFDRICKMILKVKSFSVDDCTTLSKLLLSFKDNYYESLVVKFLSSKELLSDETTKLFNSNHKVKKFYEIHFLLEANLKQVRHFIENTEKVSIDKQELIDYIKSLFEDSSNRMSIINLIEKNL